MNMNMDPGLAMIHMAIKYPIASVAVVSGLFTAINVYGPAVSGFMDVAGAAITNQISSDEQVVLATELPEDLIEVIDEVVHASFELKPLKRDVPIVSFTLDDAHITQFTNAYKSFREREMEATLFVPTRLVVEEPDWYMSHSQLQQIVDEGLWEIGGHSLNHDDLALLPIPMMQYDIRQTYDDLVELWGVTPVSFSTPYGSYNSAVIDAVTKQFQIHVDAWNDKNGLNDIHNFDSTLVHRFNIFPNTPIELVCIQMEVLEDDQWFVPIFHAIQDLPQDELGEYDVSVQNMEAILDCAQELEAAGRIQILSVHRATQIQSLPRADDISLLEHDLLVWAEMTGDSSLHLVE